MFVDNNNILELDANLVFTFESNYFTFERNVTQNIKRSNFQTPGQFSNFQTFKFSKIEHVAALEFEALFKL